MKIIVSFSLLILVTSISLVGMVSDVSAQSDSPLLKIAKRTQEQIYNQISSDSSDEIKRLFAEGTQKINSMEEVLESDDISSAKEHFLSAMKIFTEISKQSTISTSVPQTEISSMSTEIKDPSNNLQRLQVYVNNLKIIAEKHNTLIDFSKLDRLFDEARQQIIDHQFVSALETIHEIQKTIMEVNKDLREEASKQEFQRAKKYAQRYIEQLDRLIENAKKHGVPDEILEKLETGKQNLSSAENSNEIVEEIRKIMVLKNQFELTKNDVFESQVLQAEKSLSKLSVIDGIVQTDLINAKDTLQNIKHHLYEGEFDKADKLLNNLTKQLQEIKNSL